MQSCLISKSARTAVLYRGFARRQPLLTRPIAFTASGSGPEPSREAKEPEQEEKTLADATATTTADAEKATVIQAESNPVAEAVVVEEAQPSTSAGGEQGGRVEAAAPPSSSSLTAHPLEEVPEEEEEDLIASKELFSEVMDGNVFGKRGEQWLLAQVTAIGMLLFPPLTLKGLVDFGATLALTSGLVFITTAFFNLGRNISPLPEPRKKHQLVLSGIYGYVRHPMYGGLLLAGFGLAVLTRNETRLAILALLWWVLENKVASEEKALLARYPEYAEYKAKVKKFFPFLY